MSEYFATLSQMDFAPQMPGFCAMTGFMVLPAAIFAGYYVTQKRRRDRDISQWMKFFIGLIAVVFLAWVAFGIDLWLFEPHYDNQEMSDDSSAVVQHHSGDKPASGSQSSSPRP